MTLLDSVPGNRPNHRPNHRTYRHVLKSEGYWGDLAIDGTTGVRATGYNEGDVATHLYDMAADPSKRFDLGHPDYHRVFGLAATDGEVAYVARCTPTVFELLPQPGLLPVSTR